MVTVCGSMVGRSSAMSAGVGAPHFFLASEHVHRRAPIHEPLQCQNGLIGRVTVAGLATWDSLARLSVTLVRGRVVAGSQCN